MYLFYISLTITTKIIKTLTIHLKNVQDPYRKKFITLPMHMEELEKQIHVIYICIERPYNKNDNYRKLNYRVNALLLLMGCIYKGTKYRDVMTVKGRMVLTPPSLLQPPLIPRPDEAREGTVIEMQLEQETCDTQFLCIEICNYCHTC